MNGQLYQQCSLCKTNPVCAMCEYCNRHCNCPNDTEIQLLTERTNLTSTLDKQFIVIQKYIQHFGNKKSHNDFGDGEWNIIFNNESYGVGYIIKINSDNKIHCTYSTGSKVDKWSHINYSLEDYNDDGYNNSNLHIKVALQKLSMRQLLSNDELAAFVLAGGDCNG